LQIARGSGTNIGAACVFHHSGLLWNAGQGIIMILIMIMIKIHAFTVPSVSG
jgi:hypothetical protein